jgi:DNA-binding winged helix-turn-helix (wHTH) protein
MADFGPVSSPPRSQRKWRFAGCVFDEANWTLTVDGQRVPIEAKPLELLRELLLNAGNLVTKAELLDRIWPDVAVVEASLPTAVGKLRRALRDDRRTRPIIETVPRFGYRLMVPVDGPEEPPAVAQTGRETPTVAESQRAMRRASDRRQYSGSGVFSPAAAALVVAGALAIAVAGGWNIWRVGTGAAVEASTPITRERVFTALRKTDVEAIEKMLAAGWDPNAPLDEDRNNAVNILLGNCEWDPGHDQRRLLLMARTLYDGGARIAYRNAWGDTAYSIASAKRYCGPNHPVTRLLHMMCYEGPKPLGERCLANYRRGPSGEVIRQD